MHLYKRTEVNSGATLCASVFHGHNKIVLIWTTAPPSPSTPLHWSLGRRSWSLFGPIQQNLKRNIKIGVSSRRYDYFRTLTAVAVLHSAPRTWAMRRVSCVRQSKLSPDGSRRGVSGSEHFGRPHKFPPVRDAVFSGKNIGPHWTAEAMH